jgi:DNA (cytosine-5)-methyltransferase 1
MERTVPRILRTLPTFTYGSLCSGIEAATVAWHPLGWKPAFFSEIEPFPSAVLAHHWPGVPNMGDLNEIMVDKSAKTIYRLAHGKSSKRLSGSDSDVRTGDVPGGCSGILRGDATGNVGVVPVQEGSSTLEPSTRAGKPLSPEREAEQQACRASCGEGSQERGGCSPECLRGVREELCAGQQPTPDRSTPRRLQQAAGCPVALPGMSLPMAPEQPGRSQEINVQHLDALVGGFPCQDLSVAGKRKGLTNADGTHTRSGLFWKILDLADAIGQRWTILENVPGLLSSKGGRDFAAVVGGLAGITVSVPKKGWQNSGVALGPKGLVEWAILDAQFFGVAQRRRRVFIIRDSGDWSRRPPFFLEREGVRRDTPPSREKGEGTSRGVEIGATRRDMPTADILGCLNSAGGHAVPGNTVQDASAHMLIPTFWNGEQVTQTLDAVLAKGQTMPEKNRFPAVLVPATTHTLKAEGFDASEDGTGRGVPLVPVCARESGQGYWMEDNKAGTLRAEGENRPSRPSHVVAFQSSQSGVRLHDTHATLDANNGPRRHNGALVAMQVRRLAPVECERLQGFPDGHTMIPWRKKPAEECPDGPRYKAIGNSMATPCMFFIGSRIKRFMEGTL